ncbi:S26 family signal peptidase [Curtobacterium sp. Leaf261]|nr:S26 family signal peptidase [Curtobacterium sp. Leaf261]
MDGDEGAAPSGSAPAGGNKRGLRFLRDVVIIVLAALLVSFLVKTFVVRSFYIPSGSMESTLQIDDRVVVNELVPKVVGLHRGDVVVFEDPGGWLGATGKNDLIKRVIGLPGDHVSCCSTDGKVEVNGVALDEPYAQYLPEFGSRSRAAFDVTVPAGQVWVMGDNRGNSADSRVHGTVPEADIVGRAVVITWPISRWSWLGRYPDTFADVPKP